MTLGYLLDTSIVSAPISRRPDPAILGRLNERGSECAIAAPAWHELAYGCRRLPSGKRRAAFEAYLHDVIQGSFPILAYDEAAATWHGEERARLEALGRPAINDKDFARFKGPRVENWSKRHVRRNKVPSAD